jgi:hypothetical protein
MITALTYRKSRWPFLDVFLLACMTAFLAAAPDAPAAELKSRPHWSAEVKGGVFYPAADNWSAYYGSDRTWQIAGSLAYKLTRRIEAGIEGGMAKDQGAGYAPLNGISTGKVDYSLYPLNVFALFRGIFAEDQWVVPYVGGGYTRMFYRQQTEGQSDVKGAANGYHGRAGLQLLLDRIDTRAANNMYLGYGIIHTYLFVEAQRTTAKTDTVSGGTVDLGGTSYLAGFLFEF